MKNKEIQKEEIFFSIIMPIYNTEKFIKKAVNSVLNQTFTNFELLLINDCSTDNSGIICNNIANSDSRVILLNNSANYGVAASRNIGLKKANGIYIGFVDSDDTIDIDLLKTIYDALKIHKYDCIKFGFKEEYYSSSNKLKYSKICSLNSKVYQSRDEIYNQIINMETGYLWNGFYNREIIIKNKIFFNENLKVNEDFDFNIRFIQFIKNFCCIPFTGYHYAKRANGSLSNQHQDYTYEVQMMRIRSLLVFAPQTLGVEKKERQKILWLYTRIVYALLSYTSSEKINNMIERIKEDYLYKEFFCTVFKNISIKQTILINLLKTNHKFELRVLCFLIKKIRMFFPILFEKIKH